MDRRTRLRHLLAKDAVIEGGDERMASGDEEVESGSDDDEVLSCAFSRHKCITVNRTFL